MSVSVTELFNLSDFRLEHRPMSAAKDSVLTSPCMFSRLSDTRDVHVVGKSRIHDPFRFSTLFSIKSRDSKTLIRTNGEEASYIFYKTRQKLATNSQVFLEIVPL